MIEYKNLNDITLQQILAEYKGEINHLTSDWTNQQESDPGITLLETFAWLKSVQHEYLNRMSNAVRKKFLELLDIFPMKNCGAKTILSISNLDTNLTVPTKTKWCAHEMIFENEKPVNLVKSKILSVDFIQNKNSETLKNTVEIYKFDGHKSFYLFGNELKFFNPKNERSFTINFNDALPNKCPLNLYFDVHFKNDLKRTPIPEDEEFDEMAKVSFEYFGIQNFKEGWHQLEIIKDNTHNFLYPGIINFQIPGEMTPDNSGYFKIRAKLLRSEYDFPPKITNIILNTFEVVQNDCKCDKILIKKSDLINEESDNFLINVCNNLALYGDHHVYIKHENNLNDGWLYLEDFSYERDIENGKLMLKIPKNKISLENFSDEENVLMLICYEKSLSKNIILGSGTGSSQQYVDFDSHNVLYGGVEVLIGEKIAGHEIFFVWKQADDFFSSNKYDRHFIFNTERGMMIFGNHEHGQAPRVGKDNIRLCRLNKCLGADSNIQSGIIDKVITKNLALKNAKITNITNSHGGQNNETFRQAEARASKSLENTQRAVSINDYYKIVKNTPGIVFKNIKVLPNFMKNVDTSKQNCVTIAVNCRDEIGSKLPECYRKNILRRLEKFRLINTKISVIGAEYIGIILSGEICTNFYYVPKEKMIENEVKKFFVNLNKEMGAPLIFGDLFGQLDRLKCVDTVNSLKIVPVGKFLERTVSEDVIIPPNGIYYIKEINFNIVQSAENFN